MKIRYFGCMAAIAVPLGALGCTASPEPMAESAEEPSAIATDARPDNRLEPVQAASPEDATVTASAGSQSTLPASIQPSTREQYARAVECSALSDVVQELVQSDVITEPVVVRFSGRAVGHWQDRATSLGIAQGKSAQSVQTDIDRTQLGMLQPVKTLPASEAGSHIQGLIRRAGNCPF